MSQIIKKQETISLSENSADTFAQFIERVRVAGGYSFSELASILFLPRVTVWKWCKGKYAPEIDTQAEIRRRLAGQLPPSKSVQAKMKRLHGLTWEASKNRWRYRYTIILNKKKVGVRKTINLKGLKAEDAIIAKDAALRTLRSLGLKIHGANG